MKKTLYFEGAGAVPRADLENCRIRTAFHLDNGAALYLEIVGVEVTRTSAPCVQHLQNAGHVDFCHYITPGESLEECGTHRSERRTVFEYNRAGLLEFVNSLGASFDAVEILPDLAGYRVHKDHPKQNKCRYNFADEFRPDWEQIKRREALKTHIYEKERARGERWPCFSLWVDGETPATLHFHNCRNGDGFTGTFEEFADRYGMEV